MKVLVLATDYPDNSGKVTLMYIHSRNLYYSKQGIDVNVLNFAASECYIFQNISVITLHEYINTSAEYDVLICHAANIRNHYMFLKKYGDRFPRFIFFFHGHEVLKIRKTYSTPYPYMKSRSIANSIFQDLYDTYKLRVWKKYYSKVNNKSEFIFVSEWMKKQFEYYVGLDVSQFKTYIIPNSVGEVFQKRQYNFRKPKKYDFVTIRSNLDGSKYCIDVVNRLAHDNPTLSFLVIGKGSYFEHYRKSENIELINHGLSHEEIPDVLDSAKCALMPTRLDAQGVMVCEMATYGIPVITSNIDICREIALLFGNIVLIDNEKTTELSNYLSVAEKSVSFEKNSLLFSENTVGKEVNIILGAQSENTN